MELLPLGLPYRRPTDVGMLRFLLFLQYRLEVPGQLRASGYATVLVAPAPLNRIRRLLQPSPFPSSAYVPRLGDGPTFSSTLEFHLSIPK